MSCQTSLEPLKEFIQLINHRLHWSAVLIRGLEARRVVCRCRCCAVFSFCQQLLLPARLSVTLQLSANKSSDVLPAFSHPLSRPDSRIWLLVSSLSIYLHVIFFHTLCFSPFLPVSRSNFRPQHHKHPSNIPSLSLALSHPLVLSHPVPGVDQ